MTKREEILILRQTVTNLGTDSYCGPWLASVLDEVEATIRSDYFPTVNMAEAAARADGIIAAAAENAKGIIEVAKADAAKVMDHAERYKSCVEESLRLALRNLTAV